MSHGGTGQEHQHQALKTCQPGRHLLSCVSELAARPGTSAGKSQCLAGVCCWCLKHDGWECPCHTGHRCLRRSAGRSVCHAFFLDQVTSQGRPACRARASGLAQTQGCARLPCPRRHPQWSPPWLAWREQTGAEAGQGWELLGGKGSRPQLLGQTWVGCQQWRRRAVVSESEVWWRCWPRCAGRRALPGVALPAAAAAAPAASASMGLAAGTKWQHHESRVQVCSMCNAMCTGCNAVCMCYAQGQGTVS